jgi:hypothetical protein
MSNKLNERQAAKARLIEMILHEDCDGVLRHLPELKGLSPKDGPSPDRVRDWYHVRNEMDGKVATALNQEHVTSLDRYHGRVSTRSGKLRITDAADPDGGIVIETNEGDAPHVYEGPHDLGKLGYAAVVVITVASPTAEMRAAYERRQR